MKPMRTLQDLIEEAKIRTVWWALCIFAISYFLTNTSKSMWMNIPIAMLLALGLRIFFNEVEVCWKVRNARPQAYLSHLAKKQLSINDSRLSTLPPPPKWTRKIDSPIVEAAMEDFISKLLQDFVVDLWYSEITPDKEAPELINSVIMDVLGEISRRVKEINLVDLLTRDVVDLVGDHLDLFRRNQTAIGVDVMGTLSSEERDERLKHHLMASKELHPALISPECEYKVLQRLMAGLLAKVLQRQEAQCPLVRCITRELLTCLVMQPLMNFASPEYINELIEYIFLSNKNEEVKETGDDRNPNVEACNRDHAVSASPVRSEESSRKATSSSHQGAEIVPYGLEKKELSLDASGSSLTNAIHDDPMVPRPADWARVLEAATQRRTEVLMPENLDNMWTKGRNYKKKVQKNFVAAQQAPVTRDSGTSLISRKGSGEELLIQTHESSERIENKALVLLPPKPHPDMRAGDQNNKAVHVYPDLKKSSDGDHLVDELVDKSSVVPAGIKSHLKRSSSTSDLAIQLKIENKLTSEGSGSIIPEFYSPNFGKHKEVPSAKCSSDVVLSHEGLRAPRLKCRVIGAYFEKLGSTSFAVYSIAVTDANQNTWFVKRRYRNFERLHRHLKDIPNYTLHLPPKRIFSSSTEGAFVRQRCIQLDKYLQDLLSIANVAEQHEVWDFLSVSSKNYSFGKSASVMRTLAVNVDDAVDDIVRQFKGVSDGLMRKVVGSSSASYELDSSFTRRNLSWNADDIQKVVLGQNIMGLANSFSDNEEVDKDGSLGHEETEPCAQANGWHSDNELNLKDFPPRVVKRKDEFKNLVPEKNHSGMQVESLSLVTIPATSDHLEDPIRVPPEWIPHNLSVPVLNLVDNIFQLKRRGWLRRQVLWISKQILQLVMEDAIDDWLLRQIHYLRRDDIIAQGIRWVQEVLWPGGTFFLKLNVQSEMDDNQPNQRFAQTTSDVVSSSRISKLGSFEQQLEASRRASEVKKMIFNGAPTTVVSLIGYKQYRRCAKDVYYFLQSTICLKQLAYGILELLLVTVFPELKDLVLDVHDKMHAEPL